MVLRDVEHGRRDWHERVRRFQLKARELEHEDVGPTIVRGNCIEHGFADVARNDGHESGGACKRASQRGHGALAIRPGDREHFLRGRERAHKELDVADEFDATRHCSGDRFLILRDSGADRNQIGARQRRAGNRARRQRHLRKVGLQLVGEWRRRTCVGDTDRRSARHEIAREREPGEPESQHDDVASGVFHLSGGCSSVPARPPEGHCAPPRGAAKPNASEASVGAVHLSLSEESPNSTSSIVMIQKRTTTWFSFHPFSS